MVSNDIRLLEEVLDNNSENIPENDRITGLNALMRIHNQNEEKDNPYEPRFIYKDGNKWYWQKNRNCRVDVTDKKNMWNCDECGKVFCRSLKEVADEGKWCPFCYQDRSVNDTW